MSLSVKNKTHMYLCIMGRRNMTKFGYHAFVFDFYFILLVIIIVFILKKTTKQSSCCALRIISSEQLL